jgi:AraC-like DNA-binding protein
MPPPTQLHAPAPRTLNAAYARLLVGHVLQQRPEAKHVFTAEQLAFQDQHDPMARCTLGQWHELMDLAEQQLGQRDLVPELAEQFKPWHAGLLGFTLMTSNSVNQLAGLLRRFHHLLNDVFVVEIGLRDQRFFLRLREASGEASPRLVRLSLTIWAQRLRWLTGEPDLKLDVRFQGPAPGDVAPYRRIFGGHVRFDQDENAMWGDSTCTAMPIVSRDTASHSLLQGQALKQLEMLSRGEERLADKLKSLIRARLDDGKLGLEDVAAELKMPVRTLQRRLEASGLNFRLMVEDVRRTTAEQHLREGRLSLAEMATALGFADHASFNRAFKRWTGSSPGAFRRALLGGGAAGTDTVSEPTIAC